MADALTYQGKVLEIAGRSYTVRRLGLLDIQRAARILASASGTAQKVAVAYEKNMGTATIAAFILEFLPSAFDEITDWMASLIGIAPGVHADKTELATRVIDAGGKPLGVMFDPNAGTIRDPNVFPLGSEVMVVEELTEHEDLVAFFARVRKVAQHPALKKLVERSSGPSTESKPATDGQTPTSPGSA